MRILLRLALVGVLGGHVLVNGLGCASKDSGSGGQAGEPALDIDDVVYQGAVTDEALESMLGGTLNVDDDKAPHATAPADGAKVPASAPFTFTWPALTASVAPSLRFAPPSRRLVGPRLPDWLGPERSAHAHGAPFTGVAYFLVFASGTNSRLLRVATDQTSYTPDAAAWAKLKAAGATITLTLTAARLEQNLLAAAGGPFAESTGVSFTIE